MTAPDRGAHTKSPLLRRGRPHMTLSTRIVGQLGVDCGPSFIVCKSAAVGGKPRTRASRSGGGICVTRSQRRDKPDYHVEGWARAGGVEPQDVFSISDIGGIPA